MQFKFANGVRVGQAKRFGMRATLCGESYCLPSACRDAPLGQRQGGVAGPAAAAAQRARRRGAVHNEAVGGGRGRVAGLVRAPARLSLAAPWQVAATSVLERTAIPASSKYKVRVGVVALAVSALM